MDWRKTGYRSGGKPRRLAGASWRTSLALVLALALAVPLTPASATEQTEVENAGIELPPPEASADAIASETPETPSDESYGGVSSGIGPLDEAPLSNEVQDFLSGESIVGSDPLAPTSSADPDMKLDLTWDSSMFTSDTVASDNNTTLVRSTSAKTTIVLKYTLHIQLNAAEFKKDEVEIRIPSALGNYRDGSAVTLKSSDIGLGTDPGKATESVPFYYSIDSATKECVIRNAFDLSRAADASIEVAYSVDPVKVADGSHAEITAKGTFPAAGSGTQTVESTETLRYTLDTHIELDNVSLRSEMLYYWPSTLVSPSKDPPPTMDTAQYRYVKYTANAYSPNEGSGRVGNQIYDLALKLTPDTGGTVVYQYFSSTSWRDASFDQTTNTMTLNAKEPLVRTGDVLAGTGTSVFIFVVAYPKNSATSYTATLDGTATPGDGIDPPTTARTDNTLDWTDYEFTYPVGDIFSFEKSISSTGTAALDLLDAGENTSPITYSLSADATYYPKENDPAYPGSTDPKRIGIVITDDLLYLSPDNNIFTTLTKQMLTEDDYYISSASLSITNELTDRSSGQTSIPDFSTEYPGATIQVSFMVRGESAWTTADTYALEKKTAIRIPANAYRIRVDIPSVLKDKTKTVLSVSHVIRGTSPTFRAMRDKDDASQKIYLFNYAGSTATVSNGSLSNLPTAGKYTADTKGLGMPDFDLSNYGQYLLRRSQNTLISAIPHFSNFAKTPTGNIKNESGNALLEYKLEAIAGYDSSTFTLSQYNTLVQSGLPSASIDRAVFYDLLPRGARVVASGADAPTAKTLGSSSGAPAPEVSVTVTNNFRGTDRQLVKIEVTSGLAPGKNVYSELTYAGYTKRKGALSGYAATLWVSVPFDDVPLVNGNVNTAVFQNPDAGLVGSATSGSGTACYADTGTDPTLEDVKGFDGKSAFYNLADTPGGPDASIKNTLYASAVTDIKNSVSYGDGLANSVKTETFIDESLYTSQTTVLTGQPYLYRISLISGTKQISNAILFDNFGQARVSGTESAWNGTFENVDLGNAVFKGIAPVVYYTTDEDAPYFTVSDVEKGTVPNAWSTVEPSDKSAVRGIAVDISHDTAGNAYAIPRAQSVSLYVTMRAPSALPQSSGPAVLDSAASELNEYNQAAYYALVDGIAVDPDKTALSAPTVTTKLVEPKLAKTNNPTDWVSHGDTITYALSYTNETTETQPLSLTDTAPAGTVLAPASATGTPAGNPTLTVAGTSVDNAASSNAASGDIEWTCTVPPGATVSATYEVVVGLSAQGEIPNTASALIEDAVTSTHVPFDSNEVTNRVTPPLEKTAENGGGSAATAKPGDTLTYSMKYINRTSSNQKVVITDTVPTGTSLAGGTGNATTAIDGTAVSGASAVVGDTITWTIDSLQPNQTLEVTFQAVVDQSTPDGSTVENVGIVYIDDAAVGIESNPVDTIIDVPVVPDPDDPAPPTPDDPVVPDNPDPKPPVVNPAPNDPEPGVKPLPDAPKNVPASSKPAGESIAQTGDSMGFAPLICLIAALAALACAPGSIGVSRRNGQR